MPCQFWRLGEVLLSYEYLKESNEQQDITTQQQGQDDELMLHGVTNKGPLAHLVAHLYLLDFKAMQLYPYAGVQVLF